MSVDAEVMGRAGPGTVVRVPAFLSLLRLCWMNPNRFAYAVWACFPEVEQVRYHLALGF